LLTGAWEVRPLPIYTYACDSCGAEIERRQSFSDPPLTVCESCGNALRRVLHPVGVIFKGSGFYNTDYKNASGKNGKKDAESTESKPAETAATKASGGEAAKPTGKSGDKAPSTPSTSSSPASSTSSAPAPNSSK
jgi:putative FmdB family regulatory protein